MTEQEKIKALLKEAVVYRKQGLFNQAKEKFNQALQILSQSENLQVNDNLAAAIREKLRELDATIKEVEDDTETPELSGDVQSFIKKSFAFSKDREAAAIEGAMALAKFGQFDKALEEFKEILEYATLPVMIAKNIIRCFMNTSSAESALAEFKAWAAGDRFSREEIIHLREFLCGTLENQGIVLDIPAVDGPEPGISGEPLQEQEEELDISSVSIHMEGVAEKEHTIDFPVQFQTGNTIHIVVPASNKALVQYLKHGAKLTSMQCFSSIGFFPGNGTVTGKTKVLQGPNQGDFMVDIKLED